MATARPLFAFEFSALEPRPLAPQAEITARPLLAALLAATVLTVAADQWRLAHEPDPFELGALAPDAGNIPPAAKGEIRISAVIPERIAAVAPPAVRVERSGQTSTSSRFDLCLAGTTAQGYRLGFADAAPGQELMLHNPQGSTVLAHGDVPGQVQTQACARPGAQADYSLRFAGASVPLDRPITVVVIPQ